MGPNVGVAAYVRVPMAMGAGRSHGGSGSDSAVRSGVVSLLLLLGALPGDLLLPLAMLLLLLRRFLAAL